MTEYRNPDVPVVTFVAYRRDTGEQIVVDDRTFAPETMQLDKPELPKGDVP